VARADLLPHLRYLADLGVDGVSRDPAWTRRIGDVDQPGPPADALIAGEAGAPTAGRADIGAQAVPLDAAAALSAIRDDLGDCRRCKLHGGRRHIVFGVGNPRARLMFVGEAPGADEDDQGVPFVGRAGQLLTDIIEKGLRMPRAEVYIANVIKCRPPGNRNPEPDEVASCEPFLFRQVEAVRPEVIVALGTFAAQTLLRTKTPISRLRGQLFEYQGARLVPTFHPSFLLRNPSSKRDVWQDMKTVLTLLGLPVPA
jgi:DNA polymerase